MNKRLTLSMMVVVTLFLIVIMPSVTAQEGTVQTVEPLEYSLDVPCFAPTKVTFNYAYTHEHSIYEISTVGSSLYTHTGGPEFIEFIASDVDDYYFSVELKYALDTNQTVMLGIWSGSLPMQGLNYKVNAMDIIFHVRLRVQLQVSYPTEEEVASQVVSQVQRNLDQYYKSMEELLRNQNSAISTNSVLALVAVCIVIVGTTIHLLELRRFRRAR